MNHFTHDTADVAPRRGFFARAAGAIALGLAGFAPSPLRAQAARSDGPNWGVVPAAFDLAGVPVRGRKGGARSAHAT
jgi:hypothetical protein